MDRVVVILLEATDGSMQPVSKQNAGVIVTWIKLASKLETMRFIDDSVLGCQVIDYYYSESIVLEGKSIRAMHIIVR